MSSVSTVWLQGPGADNSNKLLVSNCFNQIRFISQIEGQTKDTHKEDKQTTNQNEIRKRIFPNETKT